MPAFPDVRWGSETSRLRGQVIALAGTSLGSWLISRSKSKLTVLGPFGAPLLLLTTTGVRSGLPRTTPLIYLRDGDDLVVVASNYGSERHPAWSSNLLANPEALVTIGGRGIPALATRLEGQEAEPAFTRMVEPVCRPTREVRLPHAQLCDRHEPTDSSG